MFARTNTLPSGPPQPPPTSAPGSHALSAAAGGAMAIGTAPPPTSPHAHFTSLHETCTKRIATLDYLRRSHEGRVYWFNCLLIPRAELQRIVYPDAKKLQKKAVHYFFLGNSLPAILELGTSSPLDYLRAFNALLAEYEAYVTLPPARQQASRAHSGSVSIHHHAHHAPTTTSAASSALRNMSLPKLFSRSSHRRGSTTSSSHAQHDALERTRSASHSSDSDAVPPLPMSITPPSQPPPSFASSGAGGEEYIYLATPALPFEVDYFEVFVTLCDILVDVYSRVLTLVGTPALCAGGVGEAFVKADMKIRKHLMTGIVREWEEAVRVGVKREVQGVAKEVLAGIL
ncbi:hypothetical protein EDC01DRAFT_623033 [Geopyxis carbonaria]|nr:hypothetical protein EDC01DRAFT_623033 [Geopyxis carbonaria]